MTGRDSGLVMKLLPVLLSVGMVFGLILLSGSFTELLRTREEMNQIARAYLLEMESQGHLTDSEALQLKQKLEALGLTNVSFTGTSLQEVHYGEPIRLIVSGDLKVKLQIVFPFLYQEEKAWSVPVRMNMISTAKH